MAAGDVYRLTRTMTVDGEQHINVFHFEDIAFAGPDPEDAIISHFDRTNNPSPATTLKNCFRGYTSIDFVSYECQKIYPTKGDPVFAGFNNPPGAALDTGLPTFSQWRIEVATALKTRSGRGRNFFGAIAEQDTTGNLVGSTLQILINSFVDAMIQCWTENGAEYIGFVFGVWSELLQDFNAATAITTGQTLGTMRSRRAGRGS